MNHAPLPTTTTAAATTIATASPRELPGGGRVEAPIGAACAPKVFREPDAAATAAATETPSDALCCATAGGIAAAAAAAATGSVNDVTGGAAVIKVGSELPSPA